MVDQAERDATEHYFLVTVSTGQAGCHREVVVGPYASQEIGENGEPEDATDIENAIWEVIDASVEHITKGEADSRGVLVGR